MYQTIDRMVTCTIMNRLSLVRSTWAHFVHRCWSSFMTAWTCWSLVIWEAIEIMWIVGKWSGGSTGIPFGRDCLWTYAVMALHDSRWSPAPGISRLATARLYSLVSWVAGLAMIVVSSAQKITEGAHTIDERGIPCERRKRSIMWVSGAAWNTNRHGDIKTSSNTPLVIS